MNLPRLGQKVLQLATIPVPLFSGNLSIKSIPRHAQGLTHKNNKITITLTLSYSH